MAQETLSFLTGFEVRNRRDRCLQWSPRAFPGWGSANLPSPWRDSVVGGPLRGLGRPATARGPASCGKIVRQYCSWTTLILWIIYNSVDGPEQLVDDL